LLLNDIPKAPQEPAQRAIKLDTCAPVSIARWVGSYGVIFDFLAATANKIPGGKASPV